ncbi:MAG TPA: hypothetical protein VMW64_07435 [Dehalococcoidia bacterium]|nr:hypothetical protein [Dehalococcoidia bacterium]
MENKSEQKGEREFETGKDESWFANIKRTYDEYQDISLTQARQNQAYVQKVLSDGQQYDNQRQAIANQALQNAVETANMVGKQAVRHSDIAIDRQWNVDEVAQLVAKTPVFLDAIAAAVAAAVNEALKK